MKAEFNHTVSEVRYYLVTGEGKNKDGEWIKKTIPVEVRRGIIGNLYHLVCQIENEYVFSNVRATDIKQVSYIEMVEFLLKTNQKPYIIENNMEDYMKEIEPTLPFKKLISTDKMTPPVDVLLLLLSHSGEVYKGYFDGERYRTYRPSDNHKDDYASILLATDVKAFMLFPVVYE